MNIELPGKTALVTGSTGGIGFAIAEGLLAAGASVVVNGRTEERVEYACDRLAAGATAGQKIRGVAADVSTEEGCAVLTDAAPDVDILVNNAAIFPAQPVFEIPDSEWLRVLQMNLLSGVRLARHHTPRMVQRGWGRVIFISSEAALNAGSEMVHYAVSKTAVLALARGIAESIPASGVTINCVLPGPTMTEGCEIYLRDKWGDGIPLDELGRKVVMDERPSSLLQRFAAPQEVANLVVYLASEQASYTTGSSLRVDGGVVRSLL